MLVPFNPVLVNWETNMKRLIAVVALIFASLAGVARADDRPTDAPRDAMVMTLAAEGWVETKTARVVAVADVAIAAENRATVRERMTGVLKKLAPDAEWRISRFDRSRDSAGLERWSTTAEARLPETALGGLDERARGLSQPGMQVRVQAVQFVPTLAERETALNGLRENIYEQAKAEADRLSELWPDRGYRVARVDFMADNPPVRPLPYAAAAAPSRAASSDAADGDAWLAVAQKLTLRAQVTIAPSK
jgi:hypothetical protein